MAHSSRPNGARQMGLAAVVARTRCENLEYLVHMNSPPVWAAAPTEAVRFASLRDATRAALGLPGQLHAFAMPLPGLAEMSDAPSEGRNAS